MRRPTQCGVSLICGSLLSLMVTATSPSPSATAPSSSATPGAQADLREVLGITPNPQQGIRLFQICTECHGARGDGNASGWPPEIAGQHPRVIAKELTDFRAGLRWYDPMEHALRDGMSCTPLKISRTSLPTWGVSRLQRTRRPERANGSNGVAACT